MKSPELCGERHEGTENVANAAVMILTSCEHEFQPRAKIELGWA